MDCLLYAPTKEETKTKGYWMDENGKLFVDNIKLLPFNRHNLHYLKEKNEKAAFYVLLTDAYIENFETGIIKHLSKKIVYNIQQKNFELMKNFLLRKYGGFTCFENEGFYTLEVWTN